MPLTSDLFVVYKRGVRGDLLITQQRITKKQKLLVDTIVANGINKLLIVQKDYVKE